MTNVHFVNHTHWDREWYFTEEDAQVLSDQLFADILKELEVHPEANFTLDGQTSIVDEYIAIHPEDLDRIKNLVSRNQLFIGPWYTQTDALIPDAESIIRNLVIGINDAKKKYGNPMMIGYLPDTFGFNAQLPMLLNQVGIKDFICWRGTNFKRQVGSVYFQWMSLGKDKVNVANFPFGYYMGQIDLNSKNKLGDFVKNRLDPGIKFESNCGKNDEVLIPSGIDQMNIIHNISKMLESINGYSSNNIFISDFSKFMKILKNKKLPKYQGELRYPTYSRVHRTIGSVRSGIKRKNFLLEQKILRRIEPLMIIARRCGIDVSNGIIIKLWKKLLECQPHDTLGGSVSDNVFEDIEHRFKSGNEIADGIENYIKKRIAQRLQLNNNQILVFNTDIRSFSGYKDVEIVTTSKKINFESKYQAVVIKSEYVEKRKDIMQQTTKGFEFRDEPGYYYLTVRLKIHFDGLGYKVVTFQENSENELPKFVSSRSNSIKSDKYTISYDGKGFNLVSNKQRYDNVISILDSGNDGDTYDYSPLRGDKEIELPLLGNIETLTSKESSKLVLTGSWKLPEHLEDRISAHPKLVQVTFELVLSLNLTDDVVDGKLTIDNQIFDHRLRLKINTGISSDTVLAQIQGGFRRTQNLPIDKNWEDEFVEKPVNIYNFDKMVGMNNQKKGLFLVSKGMKEYELGNKSFYVTLMASTGQLGKPNLLWRPGRASGDTTSIGHQMTATPRAEEIGKNIFEFGLTVPTNLDCNNLSIITEKWLSPSVGYQIQKLNLFVNRLDNKIWDIEFDKHLPEISRVETFLTLNLNVSVSAIYPAYTIKNAVVVRLSNQGNEEVDITPLLAEGFRKSDALEQISLESTNLKIEPYSMITLIKKY